MAPYPYWSTSAIRCLTYNSVLKKLYVFSYAPNQISFYCLDCSDNGLVLQGESLDISAMAVDENEDWLFVTRSTSVSKVEGGRLVEILQNKTYLHTIAVCSSTRMIYTCDYDAIYSLTYNGREMKELQVGGRFEHLALGLNPDLLYYTWCGSFLLTRNLVHNTTSQLAMYGRKQLHHFWVGDNKIYISIKGPSLGIYDLERNETRYEKIHFVVDNMLVCMVDS